MCLIAGEVKQILNKAVMYISVLCWKGLGRGSMHKLTGIREYQNGKSFLDSELGEINDVIGRKCLGCEALCCAEVLHSFWRRSQIYTYTAITKK